MDYCNPCRRHLNGALACPGCGTPAAEPHASDARLTASEAASPRLADEAEGADETPDDAEPGARSSRRDRKAAAHRRRRRRTLLIAAGFVLAAGGLSLAELGTDAPHSPEKPAAAGGETADGESTREVGEASAVPADKTSGTTATSGTPSSSASTSVSASPSESASKSPEATKSPAATGPDSPSASRPPSPDPTGPANPDPSSPTSDDDPPPTTTPTSPEPPDPSPTETCDRFLWWCT